MTSEGNVPKAEILALLGPVKKMGEWWMAYCPAHADGTKHNGKGGQSLGLSDTGVLRCFAGCAFADVMTELRKREPSTRAAPVVPAQPVRVYEYRDPQTDMLIAVKARFETPNPEGGKPNKRFAWRLPEGTYEQGIKPLKIEDLPLWGAGDVLNSPRTQRVWFAEGESATEAIRGRNEIAVCGAWGASQRNFGDALAVLHGRDVILWPDNDPPGREYMGMIRKALTGIARTVTTVVAPVPPKGDAVEFFQQGGKIEDLLANVVLRTDVQSIADDHHIVRVPTDAGPVAFEFSEMTKTTRDLDCELTVSLLMPGSEPEPYSMRINMLSMSARDGLVRALKEQFGKDAGNWTTIVSSAYSKAREAFFAIERGQLVGSLAPMPEQTFVVEDFLPEGQATIIFADGASGKTMVAYSMMLAIALGGTWCGKRVQQGSVLILDYEEEIVRNRMERLIAGIGCDPMILETLDTLHYWKAAGIPLADQVDALRRYIVKHDITVLLVDSAAAACGGEPEKSLTANAYFNALSRLGITSLTIAHVTNAGADEGWSYRPFGSAFWNNRARRTWFVKREEDEESPVIEVGLFCRKVNNGRRPQPLSLRIAFDDPAGPITLKAGDYREIEAFQREVAPKTKVTMYLAREGPATIAEIADEVGVGNEAVRKILIRGRGKSFAQVEGSGKGSVVRWALLAN